MPVFKKYVWLLLVMILSVICAGCGEKVAMEMPPMPVNVGNAIKQDTPYSVTAVGNVVSYNTVTVIPQASGILQSVHFQEGQFVNQGELLFSIDPTIYRNQLQQAETLLEKEKAQAQFDIDEAGRYNQLMNEGAIARSTYQSKVTQKTTQSALAANYQAQKQYAQEKLAYCSIASPISGRVGAYLVNRGNLVKENETKLVVINQIEPIYVQFSVPEKYLSEIKSYSAETPLDVEVVAPQLAADNVRIGKLTFIDNNIDINSGTVMLRATFGNTDKFLWPGEYLNVYLNLYMQKDAVLVPDAAVQLGQNGNYVFVLNDDMTVTIKNVKVDRNVKGSMTVISEGLNGNERVITDGQINLNEGSKVVIKEGK